MPNVFGRVPAWLWPLAVGVVVFQPGLLIVGPDASWYWVLGKNLANGLGYAGSEWVPEVRRGPGLPLLLAGGFHFFGDDIRTAAWVVRALFVACALVTYALGARWFGRGVGVVAACGLLVNPVAGTIGSGISVDVAGVALALLAVLWLDGVGWRKTGAAALALAGAALTKEAALAVVVPLAVRAVLDKDRALRLAQLGCAATFAIAVLALWSLWSGGGAQVVARLSSFLYSGGSGGAFLPISVATGLWQFAYGTAEASWVWPLLLVGWIAVAICAAKGSMPDRTLLLLVLSLAPVMVLQGLYNLRPGQSFMLFPLSFLALGRAVQLAAQRYAPAFRVRVLAATAAGLVAFGFAEGTPSHWVASWLYGSDDPSEYRSWNPLAVAKGHPLPTGWLNYAVADATDWLAANTALQDNIVSDWYWADALYLSSEGRRPIHRIPYVRSRDVSHMALEAAEPLPEVDSYEPILFVFPQAHRTDPGHPDSWINALSEPLLFARLEQVEADWVVVTKRRIMIADYFDASPSFQLVHLGRKGALRIYRVRRPLQPTLFDTGLQAELGTYLSNLASDSPGAYDALVSSYFEAKLGVDAAEVEEWREALRDASASAAQAED
ncbi:MAG: glycosyltransferase family 39 protein [Myxococcota bacterium]|nr:glycosyltransferase family 39 protein [Myxococcota bacterium]